MTTTRRPAMQGPPLFIQRLRWSRHRRLVALQEAIVVLVVLAVVLAVVFSDGWLLRWLLPDELVDDPDRWCNDSAFGCNVLVDVLGIVVGAVLVLIGYHFLWKRRALRHYRATARGRTHELFAAPPEPHRGDAPEPRVELARGITRELRSREIVRAQIVEGQAGAGKSTFMLLLARQLIHAGAVPVAVSLRGRPADLDLDALARQRFSDIVEDRVRTPEEAARIWRELRREGSVVVLADGLDELGVASIAERDQAVRIVLEAARRQEPPLPCVFTSRPDTVPPAVDAAVRPLPPLELEESLAALGVAPGAEDGHATLVEAAGLGEVPLVLAALGELAATDAAYVRLLADHVDRATAPGTRARKTLARVALLDRLLAMRLFGSRPASPAGTRADALAGIEGVACALLRRNVLALDREQLGAVVTELPAVVRPDDVDLVLAIGERLGLLQLLGSAERLQVRFTHTIGQSHLASRAIERSPEVLDHLLARREAPDLGVVAALSAARRHDPAHTRRLCRRLLEARAGANPKRRMLLSTAAAQTATAGGEHSLNSEIAAAAVSDWAEAPRHVRLRAVTALAELPGPESARALHGWTDDREDYAGRLEAALALMDRGLDAYDAIEHPAAPAGRTVSETLRLAMRDGCHAEDGLAHRVAVFGWLLPSWARGAGTRRPELDAHVGMYVKLLGHDRTPPGVEASLAQGFKFAADRTGATGEGEERALDLLESCRFWYSVVVLLHAVTLRRIHGGYTQAARLEDVVGRLALEAEHPFVRRAAALSARVLDACRRDMDEASLLACRMIWLDETYAVVGDGGDLDDDAAELVADIAITANLTEARGAPDTYRSEVLRKAYLRTDLPACLREPGGRERLLAHGNGTRQANCCAHGLCPYPVGAAVGRGELGEAFCHHMAELARKRQPPWQPGATREELVVFWRRMEARGRG
jgi:hypothetical protein